MCCRYPYTTRGRSWPRHLGEYPTGMQFLDEITLAGRPCAGGGGRLGGYGHQGTQYLHAFCCPLNLAGAVQDGGVISVAEKLADVWQ